MTQWNKVVLVLLFIAGLVAAAELPAHAKSAKARSADVRRFALVIGSNATLDPKRIHVTKTRHCLRCREPFESRWAGERICRRCKGSHDWRERVASTPDYGVHRRR